jgi:hypothetical protein
MKGKRLILKSSDLPIPLEVVGDNGERENYVINPAGRKFGASLVKVDARILSLIADKR